MFDILQKKLLKNLDIPATYMYSYNSSSSSINRKESTFSNLA